MVRGIWVVLAFLVSAGLLAAGTLSPAAVEAAPGVRTYDDVDPVCKITDKRLGAISGMATRSDGTWVVNDRGTTLYRLGPDCRVAQSVDLGPQLKKLDVSLSDVEDLALGPDGWLWLADSGGNTKPRNTVQLVGWRDAATPIRTVTFGYVTGLEHDAEAVMVDMLGRAVVVTKVAGSQGQAQVYQSRLPVGTRPRQNLHAVGSVALQRVDGSGPGARLVTGGDVDSTGTYVVLRTYTNAWEFDAPDGDLAAAIVANPPRLVPLPASKQGEAIAYSLDGSELLATGEGLPVGLDRVQIIRGGR